MRVVAFTGAGISKESGIDTFQDRPGIREKLTRSFANRHPEEYKKIMREFCDSVKGKQPNNAHKALANYGVQIITMNVDTLHEQAGSTDILKLHGRLPNEDELKHCNRLFNTPVLYEDAAPEYEKAYGIVTNLQKGDYFLVIGASRYTSIACDLRYMADDAGAKIVEIQNNASTEVERVLNEIYSEQ